MERVTTKRLKSPESQSAHTAGSTPVTFCVDVGKRGLDAPSLTSLEHTARDGEKRRKTARVRGTLFEQNL